jgi:pyridoxal/pyridoxine/pyridoxamine kinase
MLPLATVITPNTFEAEHLSGVTIASEADAVAACRALHALGPRIVVITSMSVPRVRGGTRDAGAISVMASALPDGCDDPDGALVYRLSMPRKEGR